jgi:uncharacterized protein YdeI (YjbR/CyaY-like superfamily)
LAALRAIVLDGGLTEELKWGEHAQSARLIKFTNIQQIIAQESIIKTYIYEAMEVEKAGLKVEFKKHPEPTPEAFQRKLEENPVLKTTFEALTPDLADNAGIFCIFRNLNSQNRGGRGLKSV